MVEMIEREPQTIDISFAEKNRLRFEEVRIWREKLFETRAATQKYQEIKPGDRIIFHCGEDNFNRVVRHVYKFTSIEDMYTHMPIEEILPGVETLEEAEAIYYEFPGYREDIAEYGIIAIEFDWQEE